MKKNGYQRRAGGAFKRSKAYCQDLHNKCHVTKDGECIDLNDTQLAYRGGYMAARRDGAADYRKKHPEYVRKTAPTALVIKQVG